jgi:predicted ATPase
MEKPNAKGTPHLKAKFVHWRPQGAWQDETDFSDGTLRLIGLLWAMLEGEGPLLLEEPELSLHPDVVRQVPLMFARLQQTSGRQVFVSTHSPDLLSDPGIGLDEVFLLEPGAEGTAVRAAAEYEDIEALLQGGMPLGEAIRPYTAPPDALQLSLPLGS